MNMRVYDNTKMVP